jgi:hypothetical protein
MSYNQWPVLLESLPRKHSENWSGFDSGTIPNLA